MEVLDLSVACPSCHSTNVVYSCEPKCCFNHVCGDCLASFELSTRDLGGQLFVGDIHVDERDSTAPTTECDRCHSLDVYALAGDEPTDRQFVCASCRARLELVFSFEDSE